MRRFVGRVLVMTLLLAPAAAAHGNAEGWSHLSVDVRDLAPRATYTYHLAPEMAMEEITLTEGWVFMVYGGVMGASPVHVNLSFEDIPVRSWTWPAGAFALNSTRLPATGDYDLTVWNPSPSETVRYAFYYDQSCNCKGKAIQLPEGSVFFNYDFPAGRDVIIAFPLRAGTSARGTVALLNGEAAAWPEDFQLLLTHQAAGPHWLNLTFKTQSAGRYYVVLQAVEGGSTEAPLELTPLVTATGGEAAGSAGVSLLGIILCAGTVAVALRRRP